jgi:hypothetical protein
MSPALSLAVAIGIVGGLLAATGVVGVWPALVVIVAMLALRR